MTPRIALVSPSCPPLPDGWIRIEQTGAAEWVDAIVIGDGEEVVAVLRRDTLSNPLVFVVAPAGGRFHGADRYCDTGDRSEIAQALSAAAVISDRVRELATPHRDRDREALLALGYIHSRGASLPPRIDAAKPGFLDYPELSFLALPRQTLEGLAASKLLVRHFFDRTHLCRRCGSARVHAREVCSKCSSSNIAEKTVIHHYRCGTQRAKEDFLHGVTLVCPKCDKELRHFGVDYDSPGVIAQCGSCDEVSAEPMVEFLCGDCGERTAADTADHLDWYAYSLTEAGRVVCFTGRLPTTALEDRLSEFDTWRSPASFAMIVDHCAKLADRYDRKFSILSLRINDDGALYDKLGPQALSKYYDLVVDLLAQLLRKTDSVSMMDDEILLCLPETDPESFASIGVRIREQMSKVLGLGDQIDVSLMERRAIDAFLSRMNADA